MAVVLSGKALFFFCHTVYYELTSLYLWPEHSSLYTSGVRGLSVTGNDWRGGGGVARCRQ